MKNRKAMAFGGLLMAVAVTAYSVSGTYAKYISQMGGTDTARVARWSFNSEAEEIDLFQESYGDYAKSLNVIGYDDDMNPIYDNIVAPGTEGKYTFQLTKDNLELMSEVKYKFTATIEGTDTARVDIDAKDLDELEMLTNKVVDGKYSPIKFFLSEDKTLDAAKIDALIATSMDEYWLTMEQLEAKLQNIYKPLGTSGTTETRNPEWFGDTLNGAATTDDTTGVSKEYTIYWNWDFTDIPAEVTDADGKVTNQAAINTAKLISKYDTRLGQAAAKDKDSKKVSLTVEFIAEQVK